jgi:hypothetical protein
LFLSSSKVLCEKEKPQQVEPQQPWSLVEGMNHLILKAEAQSKESVKKLLLIYATISLSEKI